MQVRVNSTMLEKHYMNADASPIYTIIRRGHLRERSNTVTAYRSREHYVIPWNVTRCSVKTDPPIKMEKMRGCLLTTTVGLLYLLLALPKASSQSCTRIKSDIQQDADCGTLLDDVEANSVPQPDIIVIQRACASGQCRSNMDNYMYGSSCGSVSKHRCIKYKYVASYAWATDNCTIQCLHAYYTVTQFAMYVASTSCMDSCGYKADRATVAQTMILKGETWFHGLASYTCMGVFYVCDTMCNTWDELK